MTEKDKGKKTEEIFRVTFIILIIVIIASMLNLDEDKKEILSDLPEDTIMLMDEICDWSIDLESLVTTYSDLPHLNEIVFVTRDSIVHFLDMENGKVVGKINIKETVEFLKGDYIDNCFLVDDNSLLLTSSRGVFILIDIENFMIVESKRIVSNSIKRLAVHDNKIISSSLGSVIVAIDSQTLEDIWSFSTNEPHTITDFIIFDNEIIANDRKGIIVLDVETGKKINAFENDLRVSQDLINNSLFLKGDNNSLNRFDLEVLETTWSLGEEIDRIFPLDNALIYYMYETDRMTKIDSNNGSVLAFTDTIYSPSKVDEINRYLIVRAAKGEMVFLDSESMAELYRYSGVSQPSTSVKFMLLEENLIVPEGNGMVYNLNLEKLEEKVYSDKN